VEIVVKIVKFHSSQNRTNQSTAANAFKVIKETRRYTRIMDETNPIRRYYVVPIVIIIASILVFLDLNSSIKSSMGLVSGIKNGSRASV